MKNCFVPLVVATLLAPTLPVPSNWQSIRPPIDGLTRKEGGVAAPAPVLGSRTAAVRRDGHDSGFLCHRVVGWVYGSEEVVPGQPAGSERPA